MIHSELVDLRTDRADAVIYGHTFGIVVNGRRIPTGTPMPIKDGDRVRFGLVDLTFRVTTG